MTVYKTGGLVLFALTALSACGGGGTPPGGSSSATPPPVVTRSYSFPAGNASAANGDTAWDITGVTTTLSGQFGNAGGDSYDTLRVDVTFAQNIANALPSPGQLLTNAGNQLGVGIALDTDANTSTGTMTACDLTVAKTPFEYVTDQGDDPSRLGDGNYSIIFDGGPISSGGQNPPSEAMTTVSGNTFSQTFFLTAINVHAGKAVPKIGVAVGATNGTFKTADGEGPTDCVPALPALEFFTT